jgi:hypothetical protein
VQHPLSALYVKLRGPHICIITVRLIIVVAQSRITIVNLTRWTHVRYLVEHELGSSRSFQCIVSIPWVLILLWWIAVYYTTEKVYSSLSVRKSWRKSPASTYHPVPCRSGKEYGTEQGTPTIRKLAQMTKLPTEFVTDVTLLLVCFSSEFYTTVIG